MSIAAKDIENILVNKIKRMLSQLSEEEWTGMEEGKPKYEEKVDYFVALINVARKDRPTWNAITRKHLNTLIISFKLEKERLQRIQNQKNKKESKNLTETEEEQVETENDLSTRLDSQINIQKIERESNENPPDEISTESES
eukprot:TRINITY_DN225_c0_g1_i1.p1 TRINITY_DN225_c0_g1~~TRINITY_DN225_c0_g1_i1.p1  ORF type:complete len:142 (+),score=44.36 TRINITY_DN225_c0_g1_i1:243-668(+)